MDNKNLTGKKRPIVMTAGVFDLLHLGHVRFLEEAKKTSKQKAELIVIVARDRTVERRKGEKPVMSENQRRALVEALEVVDEAIWKVYLPLCQVACLSLSCIGVKSSSLLYTHQS